MRMTLIFTFVVVCLPVQHNFAEDMPPLPPLPPLVGADQPVSRSDAPSREPQLRYNFLSRGRLPDDPTAQQSDCSAVLGVRLWDEQKRVWNEGSLEVAVGQLVQGRIKVKDGTTSRIVNVDTGLVLEAIRRVTKLQVEAKKEFVMEKKTGDNGETIEVPVLDADGKPKTVEKYVPMRLATEVAILRVPDSDRRIRLVKGLGYEETLPDNTKLVLEGEGDRQRLDAPLIVPKPKDEAGNNSDETRQADGSDKGRELLMEMIFQTKCKNWDKVLELGPRALAGAEDAAMKKKIELLVEEARRRKETK